MEDSPWMFDRAIFHNRTSLRIAPPGYHGSLAYNGVPVEGVRIGALGTEAARTPFKYTERLVGVPTI
jgi:hypothetical protein